MLLRLFSVQACLAFDVIQQQEISKQLEYSMQQAAYQMHARQYEMGRVKDEGDEARRTLAAQVCVNYAQKIL